MIQNPSGLAGLCQKEEIAEAGSAGNRFEIVRGVIES
jgi:hypothetical protein